MKKDQNLIVLHGDLIHRYQGAKHLESGYVGEGQQLTEAEVEAARLRGLDAIGQMQDDKEPAAVIFDDMVVELMSRPPKMTPRVLERVA